MKAQYREMLKSLNRKSCRAAMTKGVVALLVVSLLLLAVFAVRALTLNEKDIGPFTIISLLGGGFGFLVFLIWSYSNAREYIRAESVELDRTYPGFYDFCQRWQSAMDKIGSTD